MSYSIKALFDIDEGKIYILLILMKYFTQSSKIENVFSCASFETGLNVSDDVIGFSLFDIIFNITRMAYCDRSFTIC